MFVTMIPTTAAVCTALLVLSSRQKNHPKIESIIDAWARAWFMTSGATITVSGAHHVDTTRSYVAVANHSSAFDIMANFVALPIPIRYLAKTELFRIPLFGPTLRAIGIVEIDRTAGTVVHEQINRSAREAIELGRSLMIYPEGTRPRDGVMKPFKKGAFTIATSMDLPVLPVAIRGSRAVWGPGQRFIHPGPIEVEIFPPVETAELGHGDVETLRASIESLLVGAVGSSVDDSDQS